MCFSDIPKIVGFDQCPSPRYPPKRSPPPSSESAHRGRVVVVKLGGSAMEDPAATRGHACSRSSPACNVGVAARCSSTAAASRSTGRWPRPADAEESCRPPLHRRRDARDRRRVLQGDHVTSAGQSLACRLGGRWRQSQSRTRSSASDSLRRDPDHEPIDLGRVGHVTRVDDRSSDGVHRGRRRPVHPVARPRRRRRLAERQRRHRRVRRRRGAEGRQGVFLTDTPGVLRDRANPASLIPQSHRARVPAS